MLLARREMGGAACYRQRTELERGLRNRGLRMCHGFHISPVPQHRFGLCNGEDR